VNQPAYVAVFDIVPGQFVRLAYPVVSGQLRQKVTAGSSLVRHSLGRRTQLFAGRRVNEPHILLAVASLRPLNISQTAGFGEWMSYKLGAPYAMGSTLDISNTLLDEVLPPQPGGEWATAMYIVYPDVDWQRNVWQLVRCSDGLIYVVNVETTFFRCPQAVPSDRNKPPVVDDDRARRREPRTARPGAAVARTIQNGQLPVLRAMNDVVSRPPAPPSIRSDRRYVQAGSAASTRTSDYARRTNAGNGLAVTPSEAGNSAAGRPVTLEASTRSTPPAPPPSRGADKGTRAEP
jgi:hypothetical protein